MTELLGWSDFELEDEGRLTHPMVYDAATDKYAPIGWDEAFRLIGETLHKLPDPNMAEFYTSGRASNEAAFLFQLFVRAFGTNNFPDCSNMCHESTSAALPESIGVAKGTTTLEDFEHTDAIFIFGQNPGTNSPRMLNDLRAAAKRGVPIVTFNPIRERALERFMSPQAPVEMISLTATPISSQYHQVKVGGDIAAVKGIMKVVIDADDAARRPGNPHASTSRLQQPRPHLNSRDADGGRASKLQHLVQDPDNDGPSVVRRPSLRKCSPSPITCL